MSRHLKLGELELPLAGDAPAQTSTIVVYGGKGMGKTNFGSVFVEELNAHRQRFSVIDPLDVWWGLQHAATKGSGSGIEVVILGGPHGDIPIEPTAGAVVADFVADEDVSTVIVLRKPSGEMWTNGERIRFVTEYCSRLYVRQGERRRPLMQVFDEAGRFCPQNPAKGDVQIAACIGAIEQLVEWGRNVGVGVLLITQRSARMNKSVSELADCMVAFRTVGPNSIKAVMDWFGENVPKERHHDLVAKLRSVERGTALVVSPGWLKYEGVVRIRERRTFDSSATPKSGRAQRAPDRARKPDLERYRSRMAETAEKAKAEDPRELRRRIKALEGELAAAAQARPAPVPAPARKVEKPILKTSDVAKVEATLDKAHTLADRLSNTAAELRNRAEVLRSALQGADAACKRTDQVYKPRSVGPSTVLPAAPRRVESGDPAVGTGGLRRILVALAQRPQGLSPRQLGVRAGLSSRSGTFSTYLSKARTAGWITGPKSHVTITPSGLEALGSWEPLPTGRALLAHWLGQLGGSGAARILEVLAEAYPEALTREQVGERAGLAPASGTFSTYLSKLRTLELIEGRTELRCSPELHG